MILTFILGIILGFPNQFYVSKPENRKPVRQTAPDALPKNLEAERAVLGAIVLDSDAMLVAMSTVRDSDFVLRQNQLIFRAMQTLVASAKPIDFITILETLGEDVENAGGAAYVTNITDGLPRSSNVEHYAHIVREKSQLRELMYICDSISQQAQSDSTPGEVIERAVGQILNLSSKDSGLSKIAEWKDASKSAMALD